MKKTQFTLQFKQQVIRECIETGNPAMVARSYDLNDKTVEDWLRECTKNEISQRKSEDIATHVTSDEYWNILIERAELASENEKLKRALVDQAMQNSMLRDQLKKGKSL